MTDRWDEISKIYHAALELRGNERANFLASSVEDVEIRTEVESLLASSSNGDAFLESPAIEIAAKSMAKELQRSLLGRELGNYRIVSLLGTGGMGEIFRAKDRKLGRDVAIKILPEEFASDKYRAASFRREALLL